MVLAYESTSIKEETKLHAAQVQYLQNNGTLKGSRPKVNQDTLCNFLICGIW